MSIRTGLGAVDQPVLRHWYIRYNGRRAKTACHSTVLIQRWRKRREEEVCEACYVELVKDWGQNEADDWVDGDVTDDLNDRIEMLFASDWRP